MLTFGLFKGIIRLTTLTCHQYFFKNIMIERVLRQIGLEQKEINVYLKSLELGTQPASIIASRTDIPRNTTRFILDKLVKRGLISKSKRANTQIYTPENPENIIRFIETKRNKLNNQIDKDISAIKEVMVELESRSQAKSSHPKITFYEGEDGLINVYEDTLSSQETIRSFASFDAMHGNQAEYFDTYYKRRAKKNIFIRSIHPDSDIAKEKSKHNKEEFRESCLIPKEKYNFSPEIQFYDNKINIASWKEKLGIIIESEEIYQTFVTAFELAWAEAKRLEKEGK
jgi:sugar-specific transcriptional regulator TrmB